MRRLIGRLRASSLFCLVWLFGMLVLFVLSMGNDLVLLGNSVSMSELNTISGGHPPVDRRPPPSAGKTAAPEHGRPPLMVEHLMPPKEAASPAPPPPPSGRGVPPGKDAPGIAGAGSFALNPVDFVAEFTLSVPAPEAEIGFQKSPAAWMIDLPGVWKREGQETYIFAHPVVRKVRILPLKDRVQFKFYYNRTGTRGTQKPAVEATPGGLRVRVENP